MRFLGLTLCLLASSFTARAESVEERIAALEARVKSLEQALGNQAAKPAAHVADGTYKGQLPNGDSLTLKLADGHYVASTDQGSKEGAFEVMGDKDKVVVATVDGKPQFLRLEGDHLKNDTVDLTKSK
jgi:hypothetical protein